MALKSLSSCLRCEMNHIVAMVLAGGMGNRMSILTEERSKPALVFAGKYRVIDFTLSNCVNSGISHIGLLTQYRPRSLMDHVGNGKPWDLDREQGGITILPPFQGRRQSDWYRGTADAVFQNLEFVEESQPRDILVLAGDHVYQADYDRMVEFHRQKGADCTLGVIEVPLSEANRYGLVTLDGEGNVVRFEEKPERPRGALASMGIYVFREDALLAALSEDARRRASHHDLGADILPSMMGRYRVAAFPFSGYWRDVGTIEAYFQANQDFLQETPPVDLNARDRPIRTRHDAYGPSRFGPGARVTNSLIGAGAVIEGEVRDSVLSPGVNVGPGARVEDAIIFHDTVVGPGAVVHRSIVDKEVTIGRGAVIGEGEDMTPNREEPSVLHAGITLVGKRARVPGNVRIGRNCKIAPGVRETDFPSATLASGESVASGRMARVQTG